MDDSDDWKTPDPSSDPAFTHSIAFGLAVFFAVLGFGALSFGNSRGGFIALIVATFALISGLFRVFHGNRQGGGPVNVGDGSPGPLDCGGHSGFGGDSSGASGGGASGGGDGA